MVMRAASTESMEHIAEGENLRFHVDHWLIQVDDSLRCPEWVWHVDFEDFL